MRLSFEQQEEINNLAIEAGLPKPIVGFLFRQESLTFKQATELVLSAANATQRAERALHALSGYLDEGTLNDNVDEWLRDIGPSVVKQEPLIMRIVLSAKPRPDSLIPFYESITTLAYQRLIGHPALGYLYSRDRVQTPGFWSHVPLHKVVDLFTTLPEELQASVTLQVEACERDPVVFQYINERSRDLHMVAICAVRKNHDSLEHVSERLRRDKVFRDEVLRFYRRSRHKLAVRELLGLPRDH